MESKRRGYLVQKVQQCTHPSIGMHVQKEMTLHGLLH
jgi:hypothetical protein